MDHIIFDFGSTQKWAKSDASLSVDALDGVGDGDRIRASGDVLFFHIVKFCDDFRWILDSFCMILSTRLEAFSRCMNGPRSTAKYVIFITFSSVFDPAKIYHKPTLGGFPEK